MNRSDVFNEIAALQDPDEILRVIAAAEPVSRPTSAATRDTTAPSTPEEQALFEIWREALRRETLGIHESFFEIGGNSISGVQVMARVQRVFGKDVPLRVLFAAPTIARLARAIAEEQGALAPAWPALGPRRGGRPARASFAQQRLWFVAELRPQNPAYAVAAALRVRGTLDVNALEWALNAIVARHEVLRTRFEMTGDGLCQMVTPTWTLELREHDLRAAPAHAWRRHAQEEALRPFELSRLPLLRARLFRTDEHEWLLCLVLHHIVADGWSLGVLESELCRLYAARIQGREADLAPLPVQYGDWAEWQRELLTDERLGPQMEWWRERLRAGGQRLWSGATDGTGMARAGHVQATLGPAPSEALRALGRREGATLHMLLAAGVATALYRFSGQEHIRLATPVAGRGVRETEALIGLFVNTLVVPLRVEGESRFVDVLRATREVLLASYEHQDVPYEKLTEALRTSAGGDSDVAPFDALFALQNAPRPVVDPAGFEVVREDLRTGAARFPLSLWAAESSEGIHFDSEFDLGHFDQASIEALFAGLLCILEAVAARPELVVLDIPAAGGDPPAESSSLVSDRAARFGA